MLAPVIQRAALEARHNYVGDIIGFAASLERLHVESEMPTCFRLGEIRHIGLNYARCNGIHADTVYSQQGGPVLHQGLEGTLGCAISRYRGRTCLSWRARGNASSQRGGHDDAGALSQQRKKLLQRERRVHAHSSRTDCQNRPSCDLPGVALSRCRHLQRPCRADLLQGRVPLQQVLRPLPALPEQSLRRITVGGSDLGDERICVVL